MWNGFNFWINMINIDKFKDWFFGCPHCSLGGYVFRTVMLIFILISTYILISDSQISEKIVFGLFDIVLIYLIFKVKM